MRQLFASSKVLLRDMASTFFFLALFLLTKSIALSVALGMALGVAQVGWEFARGKPIDVMQWMSLFLVLASGAATRVAAIVVSVASWSAFMSVWAVGSKVALFLISYATMRYIGIRRHRAQMSP